MDRAPYASDPARSRGRQYPEAESPLRTVFARDRDRLIHSSAFRRLRHKTQVFVAPERDHFRVRLTHSLEVAQIARTVARALSLDEDLTEVVALAHDLGHPPFGHAGEDALRRAMDPYGGFEHNGHAVRILSTLEARTPAYDGLNLSWEVLEGLAKHNGPVARPGWALATADRAWPLELSTWPGLEAQVASLADDIAYNAHDLDDGLRAGLLDLEQVSAGVPLVDDLWRQVRARWPGETRHARLVPHLLRDLIGAMVDDLLRETAASLARLQPRTADEVRHAGRALAAFSPAMREALQPLRRLLLRDMYTHPSVAAIRAPAERVVAELFAHLHGNPRDLPPRWQQRQLAAGGEEPWLARAVGDYVAGMTDRFAIHEHERLTGGSPMPERHFF